MIPAVPLDGEAKWPMVISPSDRTKITVASSIVCAVAIVTVMAAVVVFRRRLSRRLFCGEHQCLCKYSALITIIPKECNILFAIYSQRKYLW